METEQEILRAETAGVEASEMAAKEAVEVDVEDVTHAFAQYYAIFDDE